MDSEFYMVEIVTMNGMIVIYLNLTIDISHIDAWYDHETYGFRNYTWLSISLWKGMVTISQLVYLFVSYLSFVLCLQIVSYIFMLSVSCT